MIHRTTLVCVALVAALTVYATDGPAANGPRPSIAADSDTMVVAVSSDRKTVSAWTQMDSCFKHAHLKTPLNDPNIWIENDFCCIRHDGIFYAINNSSPNWTQIAVTDEEMDSVKIGPHFIVVTTELGTFVYGAKADRWSGVAVSGDDILPAQNGG
jgi:hypothetical protein